MDQELIHVYFMPGMAAHSSIYENIMLPEDLFKTHFLEWEIPLPEESISHYAKRLCDKIKHKNPVLIGVSFGGIMVQEMSKQIRVKKVIIISSVKDRHELPLRFKLAKFTRAYKLIPAKFTIDIEKLTRYAFGKTASKRVDLYKKFLAVNDPVYLNWAIRQVILWEQEKPLPNTIHIHGEKDGIFPCRHLKDFIKVKGGTHIMIINRFRWFNENLPKLILT